MGPSTAVVTSIPGKNLIIGTIDTWIITLAQSPNATVARRKGPTRCALNNNSTVRHRDARAHLEARSKIVDHQRGES